MRNLPLQRWQRIRETACGPWNSSKDFCLFAILSYLEWWVQVKETHMKITHQPCLFLTSHSQRHFTHAGNVLANTDVDTMSLFQIWWQDMGDWCVCVCVNVLLTILTHTHTHSEGESCEAWDGSFSERETKCGRRMKGKIFICYPAHVKQG